MRFGDAQSVCDFPGRVSSFVKRNDLTSKWKLSFWSPHNLLRQAHSLNKARTVSHRFLLLLGYLYKKNMRPSGRTTPLQVTAPIYKDVNCHL